MKRTLLAIIGLAALSGAAFAQTIPQQTPGPRLIDGSVINQLIDGETALQAQTTGSFCTTVLPTTATDIPFYVANRAMRLISVSEVHAVAAGGASVLQVTKDTGTTAPGAGTDLLTNNTNTGFNLNAAANTVQVGALVTTAGLTSLAIGDRLSLDFAQAIQSSAGIAVTACMTPI